MKMNRVNFSNDDSFSKWVNNCTDNMIDTDNTVTVIDDSEWIKIDLTTDCKSLLTAVNRMFSVFTEEEMSYYNLNEWKTYLIDAIKAKQFFGGLYANTMYHNSNYDNGWYSWEIEWLTEDTVYIFFNLNYKWEKEDRIKNNIITEIMKTEVKVFGKNVHYYSDFTDMTISDLQKRLNNLLKTKTAGKYTVEESEEGKLITFSEDEFIQTSKTFEPGYTTIQLTGKKTVNRWVKQNSIKPRQKDILDSKDQFDLIMVKNGFAITQYFYADSVIVTFSRNFAAIAKLWLETLSNL